MRAEGDELFMLSEDYAAAAEAYTRALSGSPGADDGEGADADADAERCAVLLRRSAARLRAGDAAGALEDAEDAAELRPGEDRAYLRRGIALFELGRMRESLEVLRKAERLVGMNAKLATDGGDAAGAGGAGGDSGLARWIDTGILRSASALSLTSPWTICGTFFSTPYRRASSSSGGS